MAQRRRNKVKTVQRMTRNVLVQQKGNDNPSVRRSRRVKDWRLQHKYNESGEHSFSVLRSHSLTRDAPDRRKQKINRLRIRNSVISRNVNTEFSVSLNQENESTKRVKGVSERETKLHIRKRRIYRDRNRGRKENVPLVPQKEAMNGEINSSNKLYLKKRILAESRGDSRKKDTDGTTRPQNKNRLQFSNEEIGIGEKKKSTIPSEKRRRNSREQTERYQNTDYFNLRDSKNVDREKKQSFNAEQKRTELNVHSRKGRVYQESEHEKRRSRLIHGEPGKQMLVAGSVVAGAAVERTKKKIRQEKDENVSVQAVSAATDGVSGSVRLIKSSVRSYNRHLERKSNRIQDRKNKTNVRAGYQEMLRTDEKLQNSSLLRKQIQKARIKREYAKAKQLDPAMQGAPVGTVDYIKKVGGKVTDFFKENRKFYISIAVLLGLIILIMVSVTSCSALFMNNIVDYSGYSYLSTDQALREVELYYTKLEAKLQERINQMEIENAGYDLYRYDIGMIEHDPFILASYLSAKYGVFEFDQTIRNELDSLFEQQYKLSTVSTTETFTETRTVRVGESLGSVVTSGYCACSICCGQWSGGPTASGVYPTANHTLAVDAFNPIVPLGTKVVMNGTEYTVEDTGNFAQYGVAFDVYYDDHNMALQHGHRTWEAYLSDANGNQSIEVTSTSTKTVCSVTLTNISLSAICQERLDAEQKEWFSGYNHVKGNLQMFETPIDYYWYYLVSSYYGYRIHPITGENQLHNGIDIAAPEGTAVMSGLSGKVTSADYNDSYGNYIILESAEGYEIRYAHLNRIDVSAGEFVEKGTQIGTVGNTGNSTGAHLHLELLYNGERLNPIFYFETGEGSLYGDVEYSSEDAQRFCEYAVRFIGTPYVWGGFSPSGFDCSGFVSYCLTYSGVKNTGHQTTWGLMNCVTLIPESEMQPGDIIFFQGTYNAEPPTHVAIYLGNGQMVHSGHPNQITSISGSYWQQHWYAVGRW